MIRKSAILMVMVLLWGGCRADEEKPRNVLITPSPTPADVFTLPQTAPILTVDELSRPEGMSTLSEEAVDAHLVKLVAKMQRPDASLSSATGACFFPGIVWQGDDHVMRAEGTADSEGCVTKNESGQDIVYQKTKAAVSIVVACEEGGLTQIIPPGSQLTAMNPAVPTCSGKRGAVFYQSKITGDAELPIDGSSRVVSLTWIGARGQDERTPCTSERGDSRLTVNDGCQDIGLFRATYDDQSSGYYHRFQFNRVSGDKADATFDEGHLAVQVNDWDGEVSFTPDGTYAHLKRGEEERTTRLF